MASSSNLLSSLRVTEERLDYLLDYLFQLQESTDRLDVVRVGVADDVLACVREGARAENRKYRFDRKTGRVILRRRKRKTDWKPKAN